jgi:hypothetical protein
VRPVVFGLIVALAGFIGATEIAQAQRVQPKDKAAPVAAAPDPAASKAAAMAKLPALIETIKISCTPTDARAIGTFPVTQAGATVSTEVFEVACQQGMGYIIGAPATGAPQADDCVSQMPSPGAAPTQFSCSLPANANPIAALQPWLTQAGVTCVPDKAKLLGRSPTGKIYEVACQTGNGFVLSMPAPTSANPKPTAVTCLATMSAAAKCTLSTEEQNMAPAKALLAKAPKQCTVVNTRYVMTGQNGDYFEYECSDKTGFMILASQAGEFVRQVNCADARGVGGGCTLTQGDAGATADNALYTRLAKAAGFNCDVSKYSVFPVSGSGREIVEMACSNRPDGAVGIFPGAGKAEVLNCGRSAVENYRCTLTPPESAFIPVTAQLAAKGKSSCKVSAIRPIGVTPATAALQLAFIEVACADGDPGWVIVYPKGVNEPQDVLTCGQAAAQIQSACQLPTNRPR